jgi:hypothetical protein
MSTITINRNTVLENEPITAVDIDSHPLSELVPPRFFLTDYIGRKVSGVEDMEILAAAHRLHKNVMLPGPTGSAKTSLVYAYGAKVGLPVVNVACNGGADVRQLLGGWSPKPDGTYHYVGGDLVEGVRHGAVILLNEINFLPPKIAAIVYGLLDRRRTIYLPDAAGSDYPTQIKAHPSVFIVADYNPNYIGTRPINEALLNRFAIKMTWDYDPKVEKQLVSSASLLELATKLRERSAVGDINTPISTNALMEFEELAWDDSLGFDFACDNFVNSFDLEERKVVKEVLEVFSARIKEELFGAPDTFVAESDKITTDHPEYTGTFGGTTV